MRLSRRARRGAVVVAAALAGTCVLAAPASAADAAHDPGVYCTAYSRGATAFVFVGIAQVPTGHTPPIALTVTCRYTSSAGSYTSTTTAPGYAVVTVGSGLIGTGPITVCESAVALYEDGHTGTVTERCGHVGMPVAVENDAVAAGTARCENQRAPGNRWLLVISAVAPLRTVPASSVALRCWLDDTDGNVLTVSGTTPGEAGVTAGLTAAALIAEPTRKCVQVRATYLDGSFSDTTTCEDL